MVQSCLALLCVPVYHWYFQWNGQVLPYCVSLYIIGTFNGKVKSCLSLCPCISLVLSMEQSSLALLCDPVYHWLVLSMEQSSIALLFDPIYHWYFQWNSQVLPYCVSLYIIGTFNGTVISCLTV